MQLAMRATEQHIRAKHSDTVVIDGDGDDAMMRLATCKTIIY